MSDVSADPGVSGRLVSGEAVELDVRVARLGSRVLAFFIDVLVWIVAVAVLALIVAMLTTLALPTGLVDRALVAALVTIFSVAVLIGIPTAVETWSKGRSLGKAAMGLRVVRDDGGPVRFRHSLVRWTTAAAVEFPGLLLPGVTWLATLGVMLTHPAGKRLGDLSAGTIVIHERTPAAKPWVPVMPPGLAGWAATADLTAVDDELALAVRHFLARNHDISEPARTRLGLALAGELSAYVTPGPPPHTPGWAFLAAVLAERYRRNAARLAAHRRVTAQVWDTLYSAARPYPAPPAYPPPQLPTGGLPTGVTPAAGARPGP